MSMPTVNDTTKTNTGSFAEQAGDVASAVSDRMSEYGQRAQELAGDAAETAKMHPYATMAIAAGLAFAVGALWKAGSSSRQSRLDALLARVPDHLPSRKEIDALVSRWR